MTEPPRVNTKQKSIEDLLKLVDLTDPYKYSYIWNNNLQSLLIESILVRIPIGAFWLDYNDRSVILDGLQRLLALKTYIDNSFCLTGLTYMPELNGLKYLGLPRNLQRRILETNVTVFEVFPCSLEATEDLLKRIK